MVSEQVHSYMSYHMRSTYQRLGLETRNPLDYLPLKCTQSQTAKLQTDDDIKAIVANSLTRQREEMMDQFKKMLESRGSQINPPFIGYTLFKVQVNFDIPTFQGKIDVDVVDDWVSKPEMYFSFNKFLDEEKITFSLLKDENHVKDSWEAKLASKAVENGSTFIFYQKPTWGEFMEHINEEYFPIDTYE